MAVMTDGERIAEERIAEAARTGQDWLDLGGLALTKLPDALSKLTKLKRLSLGDFCQVTAEGVNDRVRPTERSSFSDISALSGLIALQELYLENTRCDDLSPIAKLQHLQRLSCPGTKVSDLSHITGLHQLQQLDCSSTQEVGALERICHRVIRRIRHWMSATKGKIPRPSYSINSC